MNPLDAATLFATVVGLICNWKQERAGEAGDAYQSFMLYLTNHNFNELCGKINASTEIQRELQDLLAKDHAALTAKLDVIIRGVSALSDKLDGFRPLVRAMGGLGDGLSKQAISLLKGFILSGAVSLLYSPTRQLIAYLPGSKSLAEIDPVFLADDLGTLAEFGMLRIESHNDSGDPVFAITRAGAALAKEAE